MRRAGALGFVLLALAFAYVLHKQHASDLRQRHEFVRSARAELARERTIDARARARTRSVIVRNCVQIEAVKRQIRRTIRAADKRLDSFTELSREQRRTAHKLNAATLTRFKSLRCNAFRAVRSPP